MGEKFEVVLGVQALKYISPEFGELEVMADREDPDFLSEDALKESKVVNKTGENIGKIEKLMIDLSDGRIAYAVLSFGEILDKGINCLLFPGRLFKQSFKNKPSYLIFLSILLKKQKALIKITGL